MNWSHTVKVLVLVTTLSACAPAFDWREFTPQDSGIVTTFPCRPDRQVRDVAMAGAQARMHMLVCSAGGATFALSFLDIANPARVADALIEMRAAAVTNLQGANPKSQPAQVSGMTPNPNALRLSLVGRLPDGAAVQAQAAFFAKGLRVYQAIVIGPDLTPQASQTFLNGLRFPT